MAERSPERKKLQKLSRMELLELLLAQTRETELLREKLAKAEEALTDRYLKVTEAGDLAHAVLAVNDVVKNAQDAANQYLDNIERMQVETEKSCRRMIDEARREAEMIRSEAAHIPLAKDTQNELTGDTQ